MLNVHNLTKRYGTTTAVDRLTFSVRPGVVTGFLGPRAAGKSTTLRMIIGLDTPTAGHAIVNGRRYCDHPAPLHEVGALIEGGALHTGRSAYHHLLALAATTGIPARRVTEIMKLVGIAHVADRRAGGVSLGMRQRLGIAGALLGDPATIILDEPGAGLGSDGVDWLRRLLKSLAAEGRTVLVASQLISELALTAEHLIAIEHGRLVEDVSMADFLAGTSHHVVRVRSPHAAYLRDALVGADVTITTVEPTVLLVEGLGSEAIGETASQRGYVLHELTPEPGSLDEAFVRTTRRPAAVHAGALASRSRR